MRIRTRSRPRGLPSIAKSKSARSRRRPSGSSQNRIAQTSFCFGARFGGTIPGKGRWIGHGGAAPGMSGLLMHFLDSGYTVVALANRDSPASDAIVNFAAHRLPVD